MGNAVVFLLANAFERVVLWYCKENNRFKSQSAFALIHDLQIIII